jgi:hypothetical protein
MRFEAFVEGNLRPVAVHFGDEDDVRAVSRWRGIKGASIAVRDALEFARLASKRWRYYRKTIPCATSRSQLRRAVQTNAEQEVSLILLAKANWFSKSIPAGLAQCRKTYCNHLVLEFLSVHPHIVGDPNRLIQGIGSGLLLIISELALQYGIERVWGEATAFSAPFYAKAFRTKDIKDLFIAGPSELKACREGFRKGLKSRP